jgi:hypothetical protein
VAEERAYREAYDRTSIALRGRVLSTSGEPIGGATLELAERRFESDEDGRFFVDGLTRHDRELVVSAESYRTERHAVHLARSLDELEMTFSPVLLVPTGNARLLFGGDVQLGRRFLDTDESALPTEVPPDDPDALILSSDPEPGTRDVFRFLQPSFHEADFVSVNLETVVTDTPSTPDLDNTFLFFTLPGSIPALRWAGIDYCSLANNHIYDYLDDGLRDTLAALDGAGMAYSGAGLDVDAAFSAHRRLIAGHDYSLLSLVSIEGIPVRNATGATAERSGAADLNDDARILAAIERERAAGHIPIATLHTGYEYTEFPPDDYTLERMNFLADSGAALVVSHHPHVAQGFHFRDGTLVAHSLGNFAFDQERSETVFGLVLAVDLRGDELLNARARPVFIEDFVPRSIAGAPVDHFARRIAASSAPYGAVVVPYAGGITIAPPERAADFAISSRKLELDAHVADAGFALVDLRPHLAEGESIANVASTADAEIRLGRDIVVFGDMEDSDVDDEVMEGSVWYTTGLDRAISSFPCRKAAYRGAVALCSIRQESSATEATMSLRNRARVIGDKLNLPNKELSLLAYVSGDNAGPARAEVTYHASFGEKDFGAEDAITLASGTYAWHPVFADLHMPPDSPEFPRNPDDPYDPLLRTENARSFRLFFHHRAPRRGAGIFRVDDVAVVSWEEAIDRTGATDIATPHPRDFLRVEGAPGTYRLTVELRRHLPQAAVE